MLVIFMVLDYVGHEKMAVIVEMIWLCSDREVWL